MYHAGVKGLVVERAYEGDKAQHDYLDEPEDANAPKEELQFLTHLKNGQLKTERVRRAMGCALCLFACAGAANESAQHDAAHGRGAVKGGWHGGD